MPPSEVAGRRASKDSTVNPPSRTPLSPSQPSSQDTHEKNKPGKSAVPPEGPSLPNQVEKVSNAELKKLQKAKKQAEREKKAQERQGGAQAPVKGQRDDGKPHHKRTVSMATDAQKPLPIRGQKVEKTIQSTPQKDLPIRKGVKQVALFGHLYGQPRRTSLLGSGQDVHPTVLALGLQMSNYVVCGSNARCVATLLVFKRVIESYITPPGTTLTRHLPSHLSPQIEYLVSCRPLSISMGNAIRWLKLEISTIDISTPDELAKAQLCDAIDNFIRERVTVADQVIAESAAGKIVSGDVILTYAKSSIVQQTLLLAHARGTRFRVIVIDSRPLFEGKHLARTLADAGLTVQYSMMHGVAHAIKDATKVLLGAHAMMSNGALYSRVGTAMVAMTANEIDIPVIVCCESIKFTERVALDSIVNNEVAPPDELVSTEAGQQKSPLADWRDTPNLLLLNLMYDVTPAEYIKMVISEHGSLPPSSVPVVHRLATAG
ncbi:MAG: hypothetical protein M1833_007355 [Piccolia ochrophora]|nr:MAG: hypothetical protein M1833_007355 [Piccolia ochrophora]